MSKDFIIKELDKRIVKDVHQIDEEFVIDAKLILKFEDNRLTYQPVNIPPYTKRYPPDDYDYSTYVNNPEKTVFLAYADGRVVGQLILHHHWNNFAWVEGIGVDKNYRRQGIGQALVKRGLEWARKYKLLGIMVETQDNNVGACRFYSSCGFVLKGLDTGLYHASEQCRDEIALFWYLLV
jgi:ribosomal protein S18 acetylase RimI-like enzyme